MKTRINRFNGSFLSLVFLSIVTIFITLALFTKTLPILAAKTLYFCQQFLSNTLFQIPHTIPNTFVLTLGVAVTLGTLSFLIQLWKTQKLVKRLLLKRISITKRAGKILAPLGLENKVYLIKDPNLFSFCFGIISPHIIITTGLVSSLDDKELEAVILHEQSHLQSLDPLKILLGKTISWMFFFLPIFRELYNNMNTTNEILADHFVIKFQGNSSFLKSTLRKILIKPQIKFATVPAISNPDSLEIRIRRIVNPIGKRNFGISPMSILTSIVFFVASLLFLQVPVNAFQMEKESTPSYFMCSSDNACRQECNHNAQTSTVSSPNELFSKDVNFSSSPHKTLKYQSSYK